MILTKELLEEYGRAKKLIEETQRKIDYYSKIRIKSEHGVVQGSMKEYPYAPRHLVLSGSDIKSDEARQEKLQQLLITLVERQRYYEGLEIDVAYAIEQIEDADVRQIIEMRYVQKMSDKEIAQEMCYNRETISRKINNYLKNQVEMQK